MWSDERVDELKKLWAEGLSASQIAGRFGTVSRNAVIGKVHRLGLPHRPPGNRTRSPRQAGKPTRSMRENDLRIYRRLQGLRGLLRAPHMAEAIDRAGGPAAWIAAKLRGPPPPPPPRMQMQPPIIERTDLPPVVARVTFVDLEAHHCRMPVGDPRDSGFGFCGQAPAAGQPYCPDCCQRAFQAPSVRPPGRPVARSIVKEPLIFA